MVVLKLSLKILLLLGSCRTYHLMRVVYYFVDAIYVTRSKFGRVTTETRDTTRQKRFVDARPGPHLAGLTSVLWIVVWCWPPVLFLLIK